VQSVTTFPRLADSPPAGARISEIGEILAAGLLRLSDRKSREETLYKSENLLDFSAPRSGHPNPANRRMSDAR
jgi:hypothetical protein